MQTVGCIVLETTCRSEDEDRSEGASHCGKSQCANSFKFRRNKIFRENGSW
jgi:hypothetical protein